MPAKTIIKLICIILLTILAVGSVIAGKVIMSRKSKRSENAQFKLMVRVRMGCFLAMLILLLICVVL